MVHLQKIHESLAARGVLVFVIAMHPDADEARKLTRELGVTYPVFQGHGSGLGDLYAYG
jgi:hypothetical protein